GRCGDDAHERLAGPVSLYSRHVVDAETHACRAQLIPDPGTIDHHGQLAGLEGLHHPFVVVLGPQHAEVEQPVDLFEARHRTGIGDAQVVEIVQPVVFAQAVAAAAGDDRPAEIQVAVIPGDGAFAPSAQVP